MKVLWLTNAILPQVAQAIGYPVSAFGGWLNSMSQTLSIDPAIEFHTCFAVSKQEHYAGSIYGIHYHSFSRFPDAVYSAKNETEFTDILQKVQPDVIHIFGTEYAHTLAMVRACAGCDLDSRIVVSIQGLVSVIARHYYAYLPREIVNQWTLRDIIRRDNIRFGAKKFRKRGKYEISALQEVRHVIGRTDWDEACVKRLNPAARYHFCNESLRTSFYEKEWSLDACERHSIFVSQCSYPIKGFHLMLEAMADIVKRYPDVHLYTTGESPLYLDLKGKLKQSSYSQYLAKLLRCYHLEDKVTFLGTLNEQAMTERFLKSHVFVSPSSIENSPNSVGEAMILGVPTISSDVGGVKNMLIHEKEGFVYPADEPYMIAYYICKVFENDDMAKQISAAAKEHAGKTHHRENNMSRLLEIYREIIGEQ